MSTVITELPLFSDPMYRYGTSIEDTSKQLTFYWNSRASTWHMDIHNEDQTLVVQGIALVAQYPLLADQRLEQYGMTGYFLLLPDNESQVPLLSESRAIMPDFFKLFYVYQSE